MNEAQPKLSATPATAGIDDKPKEASIADNPWLQLFST